MFNIQEKLIIELDEVDLWILVSCLRKSVIYDIENNKVFRAKFKETSDLLIFVRNNHSNILSFIEKIYQYLDRSDLYCDFETYLVSKIQDNV